MRLGVRTESRGEENYFLLGGLFDGSIFIWGDRWKDAKTWGPGTDSDFSDYVLGTLGSTRRLYLILQTGTSFFFFECQPSL